MNRAPLPQSPRNKFLGASEAVKQLKEDYAEIIAGKFGLKYDDMLHPASEETLVPSAFLMTSMLCRLSKTEMLSANDDLQLLRVTMCHTDHFVKGSIVGDKRSLRFYDGGGWHSLEDNAVLPECVWSGLRDSLKIASNVAYRYLTVQAARYDDKAASSGAFKEWLLQSKNSWWESGTLDLLKKGRLSSESLSKRFNLGKRKNKEEKETPPWHLLEDGYLCWKIFSYLESVDARIQKSFLFNAFVDHVYRAHCVGEEFSYFLANRPPMRVLSFLDMSIEITDACEGAERVVVKTKSPMDFCIGAVPWRLRDPISQTIQQDLDEQIGEIFRNNLETWEFYRALLCAGFFTRLVMQYMYFWHSAHGGAGKTWILGISKNAVLEWKAMKAMTNKDMSADQMQRGGRQQFGPARVLFGEEIADGGYQNATWELDFFNNFVGCGDLSDNKKFDPTYSSLSYKQIKIWACNKPPLFAGCKAREHLGPALRRIVAFPAFSRFFEKSDAKLGFRPEASKLQWWSSQDMNDKKGNRAYGRAFLEGHLIPFVLEHGLDEIEQKAKKPLEVVTRYTREFKEKLIQAHENNSKKTWKTKDKQADTEAAGDSAKENREDEQIRVLQDFLLGCYAYAPEGAVPLSDIYSSYVKYVKEKGAPGASRIGRNYEFTRILQKVEEEGRGMLSYDRIRRGRVGKKVVNGICEMGRKKQCQEVPYHPWKPAIDRRLLNISTTEVKKRMLKEWASSEGETTELAKKWEDTSFIERMFPAEMDIMMRALSPQFSTKWQSGEEFKLKKENDGPEWARGAVYTYEGELAGTQIPNLTLSWLGIPMSEEAVTLEGPIFAAITAHVPSYKKHEIEGQRCIVFGRLRGCERMVAGIFGANTWHGLNILKIQASLTRPHQMDSGSRPSGSEIGTSTREFNEMQREYELRIDEEECAANMQAQMEENTDLPPDGGPLGADGSAGALWPKRALIEKNLICEKTDVAFFEENSGARCAFECINNVLQRAVITEKRVGPFTANELQGSLLGSGMVMIALHNVSWSEENFGEYVLFQNSEDCGHFFSMELNCDGVIIYDSMEKGPYRSLQGAAKEVTDMLIEYAKTVYKLHPRREGEVETLDGEPGGGCHACRHCGKKWPYKSHLARHVRKVHTKTTEAAHKRRTDDVAKDAVFKGETERLRKLDS